MKGGKGEAEGVEKAGLLDRAEPPENGTNGLGVQFATLDGIILVGSVAFRLHFSIWYPFRSSKLILL